MGMFGNNGQFGSSQWNNPQMGSWMANLQSLLGRNAIQKAQNDYGDLTTYQRDPGMVTKWRGAGGPTYTHFGQGDWLDQLERQRYAQSHFKDLYPEKPDSRQWLTNLRNLKYAKERFGNLFDAPESSGSFEGLDKSWEDMFGNWDWGNGGEGGSPLPPAWEGPQPAAPEADYDPMEVIRSALPGIEEQRDREFASAGKRLGALGALSGTGYGKALGDISRRSTNDITNTWLKTLSSSAEAKANRELQAQQAAANRGLSAWQTQGGWQMQQYLQDMMNKRLMEQQKYGLYAPLMQEQWRGEWQNNDSIIPMLLRAMYGG